MGINQLSIQGPQNLTLFLDSGAGNVPDGIAAGPVVVYFLTADNTQNNFASFIHLFNLASSDVTVGGVTPADYCFKIHPNKVNTFYFSGKSYGILFPNALSLYASTTSGGATSPINPVQVTVSFQNQVS